jgi:hypothetical protein
MPDSVSKAIETALIVPETCMRPVLVENNEARMQALK